MQQLNELTRAQCEDRLEDVKARAAAGPRWKGEPVTGVFVKPVGEGRTKLSALSEQQQAVYRETQVKRWTLHENKLIAAMEEQLSWPE